MIGATPATLTNSGCTTPSEMPAATPASIALPPASRIRKPASAARYWVAATIWRVPMMVGRCDFMFPPRGNRFAGDSELSVKRVRWPGHSAIGHLCIPAHYCATIPSSLMSLPHFSASLRMSVASSSGVDAGDLDRDVLHPLLHLGQEQDAADLGVEPARRSPSACRRARTRRTRPSSRSPARSRRTVGTSGRNGERFASVTAEQPQPAGLDVLEALRAGGEEQLGLPADRIGDRRRAAAIRHVHHLRCRPSSRAAPRTDDWSSRDRTTHRRSCPDWPSRRR